MQANRTSYRQRFGIVAIAPATPPADATPPGFNSALGSVSGARSRGDGVGWQ
jgi:hypothetical protein